MQAFEVVACTDLFGSFALLFLIMLAISLIGMVLVMLRAGVYPYKKVFPSWSLDGEKDESEEYRAYLQYVSEFLNMWGGNTDENGALSTRSGTFETSSEITTNMSVNLQSGNSLTIVSPSALVPRSFRKAQQLDCTSLCEDEEKIPFSPQGSRFTFDRSCANSTLHDDTNEGYMALTPHTSSLHSSEKRCRRFLDSPLVVSAMRHHYWVNCFANLVSPPKIGNRSGDKSE